MMRWEVLREGYGRERSRGNEKVKIGRTRFIRGLSDINGEKTVR